MNVQTVKIHTGTKFITKVHNGLVTEHLNLDGYDFEGDLSKVIKQLQEYKEKGFKSIDFDYEYYGDERGAVFRLARTRAATQKEQDSWNKYVSDFKKSTEEARRKEYEILKKEFE